MHDPTKISVIIVDDSSVIRAALSRILKTEPKVEITGSVSDGKMAISEAHTKKPDIMILDVEMPVMNGLEALPEILKVSPQTKVIMCSSLTAKGADTSIKAAALGAVECLVKPSSTQDTGPDSAFRRLLLSLVINLGRGGRNLRMQATSAHKPDQKTASVHTLPKAEKAAFSLNHDPKLYRGRPSIVAIGSSTGGPQALFTTLQNIGTLPVPIVITQHMPATFTTILAQHIGQKSGLVTHEGADGMVLKGGQVYIAPGGKHMVFEKAGTDVIVRLDNGPAENFCKPAVDPMLRSLIDIYREKILCVILTGMGNDGLKGAQMLNNIGGRIFAQDEQSSVVWGMPGAVAHAGLCSAVLPIDQIGKAISGAF